MSSRQGYKQGLHCQGHAVVRQVAVAPLLAEFAGFIVAVVADQAYVLVVQDFFDWLPKALLDYNAFLLQRDSGAQAFVFLKQHRVLELD